MTKKKLSELHSLVIFNCVSDSATECLQLIGFLGEEVFEHLVFCKSEMGNQYTS